MSLIQNERIKLLASAFNTAATSSFTVGVLAPLAASFYDVGAQPFALRSLLLGTLVWFSACVVLHLSAQRILRNLRE